MRGRVRQFFSSPRTAGCETRVLRSARQESTRLRAGKSSGSEIDREQQEKMKLMTKSKKSLIVGAALAGLLAGSGSIHASTLLPGLNSSRSAQDQGQDKKSDKDQVKEKHARKGQNSCKGKGGCKASDNGCKGENSCKGKGGCRTDGKKDADKPQS